MINKDKRNDAVGQAWKDKGAGDPLAQEKKATPQALENAAGYFSSESAQQENDEMAAKREQANANWQNVLGTAEQDEAAYPLQDMLAQLGF